MSSNSRSPITGFITWLSGLLSRLFSRSSSSNDQSPIHDPAPEIPLNLSRVITMLSHEEGRKNEPYQDHLGYWTIGVGHLMDPRKGGSLPAWAESELESEGRLSERSIDRLLEDDIIGVIDGLKRHIPWAERLDPVRYGVLIDMAFQMGIHGLLGFKNTLAMIESGEYERAAAGMGNSLWARQTPNRAARRQGEMRAGKFHEY